MCQIPPHRSEIHICTAFNGHHASTDCWCEPADIYWRKDFRGIPVLIIEHNDTENVTIHHSGIVLARDHAPDWVTNALDDINPFPTEENTK